MLANGVSLFHNIYQIYEMVHGHKCQLHGISPIQENSRSNDSLCTIIMSMQGSFQILVEVFDADTINDDFIDVIFGAPYNLSVGNSVTRTYSGRLATITLTFQVSCSGYYYGPKCDVFCEEMDNAEKRHYTCDPQTGEKVCRPGYTDPAINCVTGIFYTMSYYGTGIILILQL